MTLRLPVLAVCTVLFAAAGGAQDAAPIQIHPDNPKYFLFRGEPLVLLTATEHYGAVQNRRFDYRKYLEDAADKKITLTRLFLLFRELQSARNPYSSLKIESPDYVAPWVRTGPGDAMDGEPVYDLDQWNPEYFERLHGFLELASKKGIIVELVLFSNTYADNVWSLNPLRAANNKQGAGDVEWQDYLSQRDDELLERQLAHVRKIIAETHRYGNVYYEICNEPGGGFAGHPNPEEVDRWQERISAAIREELDRYGAKHLIAGQEAFNYRPAETPELDDGPLWPFLHTYEKSFGWPAIQIVNVHPLPNTIYKGRAYQMGRFMSKELKLQALKNFSLATYQEPKPLVHDEDNIATLYLDDEGWTIHRKRAWTALLNGAHYDFIDFSIIWGRETGTEKSNRKIRTWMKHLSGFIHSFDFVRSEPRPDWIDGLPEPVVASALAVEGEDYIAYLADAREIENPSLGEPVSANVSVELPEGRYLARLYSPVTGLYSPGWSVEGGRRVELYIPPFQHDIVVRLTRAD